METIQEKKDELRKMSQDSLEFIISWLPTHIEELRKGMRKTQESIENLRIFIRMAESEKSTRELNKLEKK